MNEKEIFNLIKEQKFNEIYKIIKNKQITNFDFKDNNYNYFIQYIINYNQLEIFELIINLSNIINIRIDILDTDGRTILYNCIKFNYYKMIKLLIDYNKKNIGISIIDMKDRLGLTSLHYSVIFNNFDIFKLLLENDADPYILSKDGSNVFIFCFTYERYEILNYLLDNHKYKINFFNNNGETLLQVAINYYNIKQDKIIDRLLESNINLNNTNSDYGLSAIMQTIILDKYDIFEKLLDKNVDINITDFYGNTPLHYIFIYKQINYLERLFKDPEIFTIQKFNSSNINGEIPLHILLDSDIDLSEINQNILEKIIMESDLNIQNNMGVTCLMKLINNNMVSKFKDILVIKPLNFFIEDNNYTKFELTDTILDILVESYYNMIKVNKNELILDWEKYCSIDDIDKLKKIISVKGTNSSDICKGKIREIIRKEKRTLPLLNKINLQFDNGIFTNFCFFTGSPIDVLFGLILLKNDFKTKGLEIILDYPLTVNINLETYYKKIGMDYPYKLDFSNIEIIWSYQKIFFPSYFDDMIYKYINDNTTKQYICIPIGIETAVGSHANILFWDINKKTLERFEPNGSNYPMGLNYNPELLDSIIENKFKQFDSKLEYFPPFKFLPTISFQILENLETSKCKKIGDPNGFCAVWCIWWVYQRMLNINNSKLQINNIADELIKSIKIEGYSFKTIIRNFSKKITDIRDIYLKIVSIDINDWIVGNYSEETLNKLEKNIFKNISN